MNVVMVGPPWARHREDVVTATREYKCHDCGCPIKAKDRYTLWSFARRGNWKLCLACNDKRTREIKELISQGNK